MIRASLEEFLERLPLFQSLLVPVTLTFLVVPPEQGKDLDNIALTVAAHRPRGPAAAHRAAPAFPDLRRGGANVPRAPRPWPG